MPRLCSDALWMCTGVVPDAQIRFILHSGLALDALGLLETWLLLSNIYIMLLWAGYRIPRLSSGGSGVNMEVLQSPISSGYIILFKHYYIYIPGSSQFSQIKFSAPQSRDRMLKGTPVP